MVTISKPANAGTMESNDIIFNIEPSENGEIEIDLDSVVYYQFGDQIKNVIKTTLQEQGIDSLIIRAFDRGALDITIKCRLLTALERAGYEIKEEDL